MSNFACFVTYDSKMNDRSISENVEDPITHRSNMSSAKMSFPARTGNLKIKYSSDDCICYRPRTMVICANCGFMCLGRVHYKCLKHPQTSFLYDWSYCPNCRGYTLAEH